VKERIAKTIRKVEAFMREREDALNIPRAAGEFVYALLRANGARRGVEIGTSYGYSALWAGAAIAEEGGELITIDRQPHKHETAIGFFEKAGLSGTIRCELGVAADVLARIDGPFDYVLSDADKPNCRAYVESLIGRLNRRAVILTDNTQTHPDELAPFCAWIRSRADFASAQVPVGNGMEMSVYLGGGRA
jgi:predicted O-methyltransferase YrrM